MPYLKVLKFSKLVLLVQKIISFTQECSMHLRCSSQSLGERVLQFMKPKSWLKSDAIQVVNREVFKLCPSFLKTWCVLCIWGLTSESDGIKLGTECHS